MSRLKDLRCRICGSRCESRRLSARRARGEACARSRWRCGIGAKLDIPHRLRLARQLACRLVEARQALFFLPQQPFKPRYAVEVRADGGQLRVVESILDPFLVERRVDSEAMLERANVRCQLREDLLLVTQLLLAWRL